jgi:hypothetical protein
MFNMRDWGPGNPVWEDLQDEKSQPAADIDFTNTLPLSVTKIDDEWWLVCTACPTMEEAKIGKLQQAGMPFSNGLILDRGIDHALAKHFGFEE